MAVTTPDAVPGEIIEAAWGDAVRADLLAHDTSIAQKLPLVGGTIAGNLITTGYLQAGDLPTTPLPGTRLNANGQIFTTQDVALPSITLQRHGAANATAQRYLRFNAASGQVEVGSITLASGSSVAYNTTSDPRLKDRTGDVDDAADLVQCLGRSAFRGRWRNRDSGDPEGDEWIMLSSHDIEDVAPYAVTGDRDAVDDDGRIVGQQVNFGGLVPLLMAALANALDRIDALEAAAGV